MLTLWFWLVWANVVTGWDLSNVNDSSETQVSSSSSAEIKMNVSAGAGVVRLGEIGGGTSAAFGAPPLMGGVGGGGDGSAAKVEELPIAMGISASADSSQLAASCLSQMDCDSISDFVPPPDLMFFLPPPPLPAFMVTSLTESAVLGEPNSGENGICNLCNWALGINETFSLDTAHNAGESIVNNKNAAVDAQGGSESGGDSSLATTTTTSPDDRATWIPILVAASFGSAAIGAVLMVILLKCRKFKILPVADSCPILPDSYFTSKSNSSSSSRSSSSGSSSNGGNQEVIGSPDEALGMDATTPGGVGGDSPVITKPPPRQKSRPPSTTTPGKSSGGSGWHFWRRSRGNQSSTIVEHPLRSPTSTVCSGENSYSEEPYVVSEHSSALYAELNSVCQQQDASGVGIGGAAPFYRTYSMNTYSEVSDPLKSHHCHCQHHHHQQQHNHNHNHNHQHHRRLISDGAYENAAYIVSDNEHFSHCAIGQGGGGGGGGVGGGASSPGLQVETDSLDTPSSSAYYSDSSNQTNGQKRRKQQQQQQQQEEQQQHHQMMMMDCVNGGDVPPPPPPPDSLAMENVLPMDPLMPVVYYPCDYGGRLVRYGHDRYGLVPMAHHQTVPMQPTEVTLCCAAAAAVAAAAAADAKRPLPPPPPCPASTVRPLPPVPSQILSCMPTT